MSRESFESLDTYNPIIEKIIVNEGLLEAKDDDGVIGSIVDRGLTFIPRAMRFRKAKKVMKKSLAGYTKKTKNIIRKFSSSLNSKIGKLESEYINLKKDKIKPLIEDKKREEAIKLAKDYLKKLEDYKKEQSDMLQKSINNILEAYTNSIHNRIDNPGFILNVELSGKGKGELKAKWQELVVIQNIKIDEYKSDISKNEGWGKLDKMISELTGFIETRRSSGDANVVLSVQDIIVRGGDEYFVKIHLRTSEGRPSIEEKGILIGEKPENLELGESGIRKVVEVGTYQYNAIPYKLIIKGNADEYIRPYVKIKHRDEPYYGEVASLDVREKTKEDVMRGVSSVSTTKEKKDVDNKKNDKDADLYVEKPMFN